MTLPVTPNEHKAKYSYDISEGHCGLCLSTATDPSQVLSLVFPKNFVLSRKRHIVVFTPINTMDLQIYGDLLGR